MEAAFPFVKSHAEMNEAIKERVDAGQPRYPQQKVQFLLKNIGSDNIQTQPTSGIRKCMHDTFMNNPATIPNDHQGKI